MPKQENKPEINRKKVKNRENDRGGGKYSRKQGEKRKEFEEISDCLPSHPDRGSATPPTAPPPRIPNPKSPNRRGETEERPALPSTPQIATRSEASPRHGNGARNPRLEESRTPGFDARGERRGG